jgi:ubiquinone/menaquinone biosynthesis C-methylase UbiE
MSVTIDEVKTFWNANPCQSELSTEADRRRYFEEIRAKRYGGREWHLPTVGQFGNFKDMRVLEIGCGIATDGLEFARRGARYVGLDLTPESVELAKERFRLFDVPGEFRVANAEAGIPFADGHFDHIYSWGVIHHSPRPEAIVAEMHRVLRPGGTFTVMLYNRTSINYYVEIMFLRRLFRYLLYPKFMPGLLARVTGIDQWKLEGHRARLSTKMTKEEWISINTDGPFCPLAKVYDKKEASDLFHAFADVRQEVWEFNTDHWLFIGRMMPISVAQAIGRQWGWNRVIYGRRQALKS